MRATRAYALAVAFGACAGLAPSALGQGAAAPSGQAPVTHVQTVRELGLVCDPSGASVPRLEAIAYCQGFLTSFGQYHALLYPRNGPARPLFCVPAPGPTIAQSGIGFAAWAREHPSHGNEPALDGLLRWAQATFPCSPSGPPARTSRNTR